MSPSSPLSPSVRDPRAGYSFRMLCLSSFASHLLHGLVPCRPLTDSRLVPLVVLVSISSSRNARPSQSPPSLQTPPIVAVPAPNLNPLCSCFRSRSYAIPFKSQPASSPRLLQRYPLTLSTSLHRHVVLSLSPSPLCLRWLYFSSEPPVCQNQSPTPLSQLHLWDHVSSERSPR